MASAEIIFGEPTNVDGFEGGGHAKSAGALVDGITRIANKPDFDENGRQNQHLGGAIGLEGAWGSGKSTVIEIAEKSLRPKFHVFTFDLWRHQSDDFRRALLEEFLDYLKKLSDDPSLKIDKAKIAKARKAVRNRQTITTTTSKRRYTLSGLVAILFLPLLPLLYSWAQPAAFVAAAKVVDPTQPAALIDANRLPVDPMWSLYILGAYLILFPVIAGITYMRMSEEDKEADPDTPRWIRWFTEGASHFLTLSRKEKSNLDIKTIRDEDPTTVEFREVFERILKPVQVDERRVVFVLDNVDRLPEKDVQRVWSDMRSLVAKSGKEKSEAVIAVIPYDRNQIAAAFPPVKVFKARDADGAIGEAVAGDGSETPIVIESDVFEKTFDRIVKVSAPVPSNWKKYLTTTIGKAFGNQHDDIAIEKLFRLLKYKLDLEGVHPTPRRIISYVNEIGSLWVQWGDEAMPVATIGLYVLHRSAFDRDPALLSKAHPVDIRFQRIVGDENYARNLAALAFNVEPTLANQVRLAQPVAKALLDDRGPDELQKLAKADGFNEFFQDELRKWINEWASDSPESISKAAMNVAKMEPAVQNHAVVWEIFGDSIGQIQGLSYDLINDVPGLFKIVEKQPDAGMAAARLRAKFEYVDTESAPAPEASSSGSGWISVMRQLCGAIDTAEGGAAASHFWTTAPPSVEPEFVIAAANAWQKAPFFEFDQLDLGADLKGLSKSLVDQATKNPGGYRPAMEVLHDRLNQFVPEHLAQIATLIQSGDSEDSLLPLVMVPKLFLRSHLDDVVRALEPVATDGSLAALANPVETNGLLDFSASALLLSVLASQAAELSEARGSENLDDRVWYNSILKDASSLREGAIEKMAEEVATSGLASIWIAHALDRSKAGGLVHAVLRELVNARVLYISNALIVAERFDDLIAIVGSEGVSKLLAHLQLGEIRDQYSGAEVTKVPSEMIAALGNLPKNTHARDIIGMVSDLLDDLPKEAWDKALSTPSSQELRLLFALNGIGARHIQSQEFVDAVAANAMSVLNGTFDPATVAKDWSAVLDAVHPDSIEQLRLTIQDLFHAVVISAKGAENFVTYYGSIGLKLKLSGSEEMADKALIQFYAKLLSSGSSVAAEYLRSSAPEIQRCLKKASKGAKKEYEVAVKAAEELAGDDGEADKS